MAFCSHISLYMHVYIMCIYVFTTLSLDLEVLYLKYIKYIIGFVIVNQASKKFHTLTVPKKGKQHYLFLLFQIIYCIYDKVTTGS